MGVPSSDSAAIRQIIRAIRSAGYVLDLVHDGEEEIPVATEQDAVEMITAVDDATLYFYSTDRKRNPHVRFVLGNEPFEVANDWSESLSPVIDPLVDKWMDEVD